MFESFSSRANQSAVDKLIQLATGKKGAAPVEEERPAAENAGQPESAVETSAPPVEQPEAAERAAEAPVEAAVEATVETPAEPAPAAESEAAVETRPPVADLIWNLAEPPTPAVDELVDGRPFFEISPETAGEAASVAAEEPAPVEAVSEPVVEAAAPEAVSEPGTGWAPAPVEESVAPEPVAEQREAEATPEPVQAAEPPVDERPFYEPPAEPAVEAASPAVEEPVAADVESRDASEAAAPVEAAVPVEAAAQAEAEAQAEAVSEPVVEVAAAEVPAVESPAEVEVPAEPMVEKATETPSTEGEAPAAAEASQGEAAAAGEAQEAAMRDDEEEAAAAREGAAAKAASGEDKDDEPFNLERFRQRQAERRRARGADIFPSADETTFLRSRFRDSQRDEVTEEELKTLSRDPMWKTLVQFKGWLPVVTRVLPLLDLAGKRASSGNSEEIKDSVEGLLVSNRDMRTTLQNQTVELKRVEEEISRLRETSDKNAFEQNALSDDVRGIQRLMKNAFLYLGILLGLLVVAVGYMAFLVFNYLNHPIH